MNEIYKKQMKIRLPKIYKTYLLKFMDEEQINQMFSNRKVARSFAKLVNYFYKNDDFGISRYDSNMIKVFENYENAMREKTGFDDQYIRAFLHVYRYYTSKTNDRVLDEDGYYVKDFEERYFNDLTRVVCLATEDLYTDIKNNNRWWELDSATALRQQFLNDKVAMASQDIQKLCKKYLGRSIDIVKDLHIGQGRKEPPMELVRELDEKMRQKGYVLTYAWTEIRNNKTVYVESPHPPVDGKYFIKRYTTDLSKEIKENEIDLFR